MNVENILELADVLEAVPFYDADSLEPVQFHMARYLKLTSEGVVACIAGYAVLLCTPAAEITLDVESIHYRAARFLGIHGDVAENLFGSNLAHYGITFQDITPAVAAKVLRTLATTGVVDWALTLEKETSV